MNRTLLSTVLLAGSASPVLGQCTPEWLTPPTGTLSSFDVSGSSVLASATWSPSGTALGQQLAIGGNFGAVGGVVFNNVATWDGTRWLSMGSGVPGGFVFTLCGFNSEVIAGGNFGNAGGVSVTNIARWNGTSWSALGSGCSGGSVAASAVYNGQLYVGGDFLSAGGVSGTARLARWTGSAWQAAGTGFNGTVAALEAHNGLLYAGGAFTNASGVAVNRIASWNGSTWSALGTGCNNTVLSLKHRGEDNSLYVGGQFTTAGGLFTGGVARWDGAWHDTGGSFAGTVNAMADYFDTVRGKNELVIGGNTSGGGSPNFVQYDGTSYSQPHPAGANGIVRTLSIFNQSLVVGGDFSSIGGVPAGRLALWSGAPGTGFSGEPGTAQVKPGANGAVLSMLPFTNGTGLFAGGEFLVQADSSHLGQHVATYTDQTVGTLPDDAFGGGAPQGVNGPVYGMGYWNHTGGFPVQARTELVVGGFFSQAAGSPAANIAYHQGILLGWSTMGSGMNDAVYAVQQYPASLNSPLYAAGAFTTAGGVSARGIASWNGTAWSPVGSGLTGTGSASIIYNGELIVGGFFGSAGGVAGTAQIARWNGTTWAALGGATLNGSVSALTVFNGQLIVGGFYSSTSGPALSRVAAWNGTTWAPMDSGLSLPAVSALAVHNGELYAGGSQVIRSGPTPSYVAKWNGSSWVSVPGLEYIGSVNSLASAAGSLWAGGNFGVASGHTAPHLAKLQCACYANCDSSTQPPVLNVGDFTCFLQRYAAGDSYANCDSSTQSPVLNVGDFTCFLQKYANGCP